MFLRPFFVLSEQMIQREADVKSKVSAVALTDSVHNVWHQEANKTIREWMREVITVCLLSYIMSIEMEKKQKLSHEKKTF